MAVLWSAIRTETPHETTIMGTGGMIRIHPQWWRATALTVHRSGQGDEAIHLPFNGNGYQFEALEAMRCLRAGLSESQVMPLDETLGVVRTMDSNPHTVGTEVSNGIGPQRSTTMLYGHVPGIDKPVSRLVQGSVMISTHDPEGSFRLLDAIFALGCNTFDTAHVYGQGDNERAMGRWVNERGIREQVVIIGKGAHHNADRKRVTPFDITADLFDSLARFKFDYIDLYLLHRDDPSVPVGPIVEVLNEHLAAGRIRAFGGSNWSHRRIAEANEYAAAHGLTPFVASSPNFSLAEQYREPWEGCISISGPQNEEARAWYAEQRMPLFTWSSLAGGFFSGRLRRDNLDTFEDYLDKLAVYSYAGEENFRRLERVQQLAEEKGLSIPQIALAYVMSQPLDIYALVGCRTPEEFAANLAALEVRLTLEECAWLDLRLEKRGERG
jgi:aryl-alcohol dehydrogenase-like predicted oxidoreductase